MITKRALWQQQIDSGADISKYITGVKHDNERWLALDVTFVEIMIDIQTTYS